MNIDPASLIAMILNILKGIYSQVYSIAGTIFPTNPNLVLIIGAVIAVYLFKDKFSSLLIIAIAGFLLYAFLSGGA